MKRLLLILGVLIWFHVSDIPAVFPDADRVSVDVMYQLTIDRIMPIMVVTVYDHGKSLYSCNFADVKGITVGDWIL